MFVNLSAEHLRSTVTPNRLSHIMVIMVLTARRDHLHLLDVANACVAGSERRLNTLGELKVLDRSPGFAK